MKIKLKATGIKEEKKKITKWFKIFSIKFQFAFVLHDVYFIDEFLILKKKRALIPKKLQEAINGMNDFLWFILEQSCFFAKIEDPLKKKKFSKKEWDQRIVFVSTKKVSSEFLLALFYV